MASYSSYSKIDDTSAVPPTLEELLVRMRKKKKPPEPEMLEQPEPEQPEPEKP